MSGTAKRGGNANDHRYREMVQSCGIAGDGFKNLEENDKVEFDVTSGPKGPNASNVRKVG